MHRHAHPRAARRACSIEPEVSPALASTFLRGNADWVLEHLASRAPQASMLAHKLLVRLNNGVDLGSTRAAWKKWSGVVVTGH